MLKWLKNRVTLFFFHSMLKIKFLLLVNYHGKINVDFLWYKRKALAKKFNAEIILLIHLLGPFIYRLDIPIRESYFGYFDKGSHNYCICLLTNYKRTQKHACV